MGVYSLDYLHNHHLKNCSHYREIIQKIFPNERNYKDIYIHVDLFKKINFVSGNEDKSYSYSSSGTSGKKSNIYFDRKDAIKLSKNLLQLLKKLFSLILLLNLRTNLMLVRQPQEDLVYLQRKG